MKPAWRQASFWAWLALACLPVDLLAWWRGWALVDPAYLGLSLLWWPLDVLGRLMALALLLGPPASQGAWRRLGAALSAEVRLGLWLACGLLAGLIPAIFLLSVKGFQQPAWLAAELGLGLLGLIPGLLYALRRLLAPVLVLQGAGAADALTGSALRLKGRLKPFLRAYLPWLLAGLVLENLSFVLDLAGLGQALPDPWGGLLTPLATALELIGLARGASTL